MLKQKYIKSFLNYTGGKYKLLPDIIKYFPKEFDTFHEICCGSGVVSINMARIYGEKSFYLNDIEKNLIDLFIYLQNNKIENTINTIENIIIFYGLSTTSSNGYEYYNTDSSKGLGFYNKIGYLKLRNDFNNNNSQFPHELLLYLLIVYGFNNQIRFNKVGQFNLPVGKRDFNKNMKTKLIQTVNIIQNNDFVFTSKPFINLDNIKKGDFVYIDPPYLISTASYNELGKWGDRDEKNLYNFLDDLNNQDIKFALSNVMIHKGIENEILKQWSNKYNIIFLEKNYNNSNYQSNAKKFSTQEVLVTNY